MVFKLIGMALIEGNIIYERNRNGGETHHVYDSGGNLLEETLPNGLKTKFTYNEAGDLLSLRDNAGREEFYQYDPVGNMVQKSRMRQGIGYPDAGKRTETMENWQTSKTGILANQGKKSQWKDTAKLPI